MQPHAVELEPRVGVVGAVLPAETALCEAAVVEAPAVDVEAQHLHLLAVAADEAVERAVLRVVAEVGDDDRREALDAGAHVGGVARYEHAVGGGKRVHSDIAALSTHATSGSADPGGTRILTPLAMAQMGWLGVGCSSAARDVG